MNRDSKNITPDTKKSKKGSGFGFKSIIRKKNENASEDERRDSQEDIPAGGSNRLNYDDETDSKDFTVQITESGNVKIIRHDQQIKDQTSLAHKSSEILADEYNTETKSENYSRITTPSSNYEISTTSKSQIIPEKVNNEYIIFNKPSSTFTNFSPSISLPSDYIESKSFIPKLNSSEINQSEQSASSSSYTSRITDYDDDQRYVTQNIEKISDSHPTSQNFVIALNDKADIESNITTKSDFPKGISDMSKMVNELHSLSSLRIPRSRLEKSQTNFDRNKLDEFADEKFDTKHKLLTSEEIQKLDFPLIDIENKAEEKNASKNSPNNTLFQMEMEENYDNCVENFFATEKTSSNNDIYKSPNEPRDIVAHLGIESHTPDSSTEVLEYNIEETSNQTLPETVKTGIYNEYHSLSNVLDKSSTKYSIVNEEKSQIGEKNSSEKAKIEALECKIKETTQALNKTLPMKTKVIQKTFSLPSIMAPEIEVVKGQNDEILQIVKKNEQFLKSKQEENYYKTIPQIEHKNTFKINNKLHSSDISSVPEEKFDNKLLRLEYKSEVIKESQERLENILTKKENSNKSLQQIKHKIGPEVNLPEESFIETPPIEHKSDSEGIRVSTLPSQEINIMVEDNLSLEVTKDLPKNSFVERLPIERKIEPIMIRLPSLLPAEICNISKENTEIFEKQHNSLLDKVPQIESKSLPEKILQIEKKISLEKIPKIEQKRFPEKIPQIENKILPDKTPQIEHIISFEPDQNQYKATLNKSGKTTDNQLPQIEYKIIPTKVTKESIPSENSESMPKNSYEQKISGEIIKKSYLPSEDFILYPEDFLSRQEGRVTIQNESFDEKSTIKHDSTLKMIKIYNYSEGFENLHDEKFEEKQQIEYKIETDSHISLEDFVPCSEHILITQNSLNENSYKIPATMNDKSYILSEDFVPSSEHIVKMQDVSLDKNSKTETGLVNKSNLLPEDFVLSLEDFIDMHTESFDENPRIEQKISSEAISSSYLSLNNLSIPYENSNEKLGHKNELIKKSYLPSEYTSLLYDSLEKFQMEYTSVLHVINNLNTPPEKSENLSRTDNSYTNKQINSSPEENAILPDLISKDNFDQKLPQIEHKDATKVSNKSYLPENNELDMSTEELLKIIDHNKISERKETSNIGSKEFEDSAVSTTILKIDNKNEQIDFTSEIIDSFYSTRSDDIRNIKKESNLNQQPLQIVHINASNEQSFEIESKHISENIESLLKNEFQNASENQETSLKKKRLLGIQVKDTFQVTNKLELSENDDKLFQIEYIGKPENGRKIKHIGSSSKHSSQVRFELLKRSVTKFKEDANYYKNEYREEDYYEDDNSDGYDYEDYEDYENDESISMKFEKLKQKLHEENLPQNIEIGTSITEKPIKKASEKFPQRLKSSDNYLKKKSFSPSKEIDRYTSPVNITKWVDNKEVTSQSEEIIKIKSTNLGGDDSDFEINADKRFEGPIKSKFENYKDKVNDENIPQNVDILPEMIKEKNVQTKDSFLSLVDVYTMFNVGNRLLSPFLTEIDSCDTSLKTNEETTTEENKYYSEIEDNNKMCSLRDGKQKHLDSNDNNDLEEINEEINCNENPFKQYENEPQNTVTGNTSENDSPNNRTSQIKTKENYFEKTSSLSNIKGIEFDGEMVQRDITKSENPKTKRNENTEIYKYNSLSNIKNHDNEILKPVTRDEPTGVYSLSSLVLPRRTENNQSNEKQSEIKKKGSEKEKQSEYSNESWIQTELKKYRPGNKIVQPLSKFVELHYPAKTEGLLQYYSIQHKLENEKIVPEAQKVKYQESMQIKNVDAIPQFVNIRHLAKIERLPKQYYSKQYTLERVEDVPKAQKTTFAETLKIVNVNKSKFPTIVYPVKVEGLPKKYYSEKYTLESLESVPKPRKVIYEEIMEIKNLETPQFADTKYRANLEGLSNKHYLEQYTLDRTEAVPQSQKVINEDTMLIKNLGIPQFVTNDYYPVKPEGLLKKYYSENYTLENIETVPQPQKIINEETMEVKNFKIIHCVQEFCYHSEKCTLDNVKTIPQPQKVKHEDTMGIENVIRKYASIKYPAKTERIPKKYYTEQYIIGNTQAVPEIMTQTVELEDLDKEVFVSAPQYIETIGGKIIEYDQNKRVVSLSDLIEVPISNKLGISHSSKLNDSATISNYSGEIVSKVQKEQFKENLDTPQFANIKYAVKREGLAKKYYSELYTLNNVESVEIEPKTAKFDKHIIDYISMSNVIPLLEKSKKSGKVKLSNIKDVLENKHSSRENITPQFATIKNKLLIANTPSYMYSTESSYSNIEKLRENEHKRKIENIIPIKYEKFTLLQNAEIAYPISKEQIITNICPKKTSYQNVKQLLENSYKVEYELQKNVELQSVIKLRKYAKLMYSVRIEYLPRKFYTSLYTLGNVEDVKINDVQKAEITNIPNLQEKHGEQFIPQKKETISEKPRLSRVAPPRYVETLTGKIVENDIATAYNQPKSALKKEEHIFPTVPLTYTENKTASKRPTFPFETEYTSAISIFDMPKRASNHSFDEEFIFELDYVDLNEKTKPPVVILQPTIETLTSKKSLILKPFAPSLNDSGKLNGDMVYDLNSLTDPFAAMSIVIEDQARYKTKLIDLQKLELCDINEQPKNASDYSLAGSIWSTDISTKPSIDIKKPCHWTSIYNQVYNKDEIKILPYCHAFGTSTPNTRSDIDLTDFGDETLKVSYSYEIVNENLYKNLLTNDPISKTHLLDDIYLKNLPRQPSSYSYDKKIRTYCIGDICDSYDIDFTNKSITLFSSPKEDIFTRNISEIVSEKSFAEKTPEIIFSMTESSSLPSFIEKQLFKPFDKLGISIKKNSLNSFPKIQNADSKIISKNVPEESLTVKTSQITSQTVEAVNLPPLAIKTYSLSSILRTADTENGKQDNITYELEQQAIPIETELESTTFKPSSVSQPVSVIAHSLSSFPRHKQQISELTSGESLTVKTVKNEKEIVSIMTESTPVPSFMEDQFISPQPVSKLGIITKKYPLISLQDKIISNSLSAIPKDSEISKITEIETTLTETLDSSKVITTTPKITPTLLSETENKIEEMKLASSLKVVTQTLEGILAPEKISKTEQKNEIHSKELTTKLSYASIDIINITDWFKPLKTPPIIVKPEIIAPLETITPPLKIDELPEITASDIVAPPKITKSKVITFLDTVTSKTQPEIITASNIIFSPEIITVSPEIYSSPKICTPQEIFTASNIIKPPKISTSLAITPSIPILSKIEIIKPPETIARIGINKKVAISTAKQKIMIDIPKTNLGKIIPPIKIITTAKPSKEKIFVNLTERLIELGIIPKDALITAIPKTASTATDNKSKQKILLERKCGCVDKTKCRQIDLSLKNNQQKK